MNKIDIQSGLQGGYDVLVNGDHYSHTAKLNAAISDAREAAGDDPRYSVMIRDFTTMGEGRTVGGVPFAIVPRRKPASE